AGSNPVLPATTHTPRLDPVAAFCFLLTLEALMKSLFLLGWIAVKVPVREGEQIPCADLEIRAALVADDDQHVRRIVDHHLAAVPAGVEHVARLIQAADCDDRE